MRGDDEHPDGMFSYRRPEERVPADHPLRPIRTMVDTALRDDSAPRFLLRDRDAIYGEEFARRVKSMGIREVLTAPRAPWQNPFVELVIGSIRRECLDHFLILSEAHLRHSCTPTPLTTTPRGHTNRSTTTVLSPELSNARIIAIPQVGGLHHSYQRAA